MTVADDPRAAGQLIAFAMNAKLRPAQDQDYAELVRSYRERPAFAEAVRAFAGGLGLDVLQVDRAAGAVLSPRDGSPFEMHAGQFFGERGNAAKDAMRRSLHGVALAAAVACAYPRRQDLDDAERIPRVSVADIDDYVRSHAELLDAEHEGQQLDPPAGQPGQERAWRAWAGQPRDARGKDGRAKPDCTLQIIRRVLDALAAHGDMRKVADTPESGGIYQALPPLRVHARELCQGRSLWPEAAPEDEAL